MPRPSSPPPKPKSRHQAGDRRVHHYFPYLPYRNVNIGRAAGLINGTLLTPGEIFSLNGVVGERTAANGFTEGYIIEVEIPQGARWGVSQSATTTFNAMFFAGLKDIEHQPHPCSSTDTRPAAKRRLPGRAWT